MSRIRQYLQQQLDKQRPQHHLVHFSLGRTGQLPTWHDSRRKVELIQVLSHVVLQRQ